MPKKYWFFLAVLIACAIFLIFFFIPRNNIAVFNPKGSVGIKERDLIIVALLLCSTILIPVLVLAFLFAWRYRASDPKAERSSDAASTAAHEAAWWIPPTLVILILAAITWRGTHELDPYKPLASNVKPLTIQVVALNWKWLFMYPEQGIATVNFVQFPECTPLNFELTSNGLMNSFWIPQLGGQMYAMAGMTTQLHLMADAPGEFSGSAAEINGRGFAGMKFIAKSTSKTDFDAWVASVKQNSLPLTEDAYNKLAEPSENNPVIYYSSVQENLYNTIVMKFMPAFQAGPRPSDGAPSSSTQSMPGMQM